MSAQQLSEIIEALRAGLRASEQLCSQRDYATAVGVLQGRIETAVRELERSTR